MTPSLESCREGIEHSLADGAPTLARVAALMGTSPRTLPRRLQEFGARFAKLRDDVRRERASQLLARSDLQIAAVATRLGFLNPCSSSRWF